MDDPCVGIRRDDLLPERLRAPADEEEAAGDAVDDLPQRVAALDAAVGADLYIDDSPTNVQALRAQGLLIPAKLRV